MALFYVKEIKTCLKSIKRYRNNFISIDDNEQAQLKLLCDEIFGDSNFIACLPTIMNLKGNQDQFGFAGTHEYTLVYTKDITKAKIGEFIIEDEDLEEWKQDDLGYYKRGANLKSTGVNAPRSKRPNLFFPVFVTPDGNLYVSENNIERNNKDTKVLPITDGKEMSWRWSKDKFKNETHNLIIENNNGTVTIYKKQRPSLGDLPSKKPKTIFYKPEYSSGNGTAQLKDIFSDKVFSNPKPIDLIKDLIHIASPSDGIVLDFMAGSGTTGQAVLKLNTENKSHIKFILCTNNENNICEEITYPRIEKVILGYTNRIKVKTEGLGGSLKYFKTKFIKKTANKDDLKIRITKECTEMLCLREGIFDEIKTTDDYRVFQKGNKVLAAYYSLDRKALAELKKDLSKIEGDKILYCFTLDPLGLNKKDFSGWKDVTVEPIPQKILDVYKQIYEY
jgi:adenine-specific DNA-methyltransferase